MAKWGRAPLLLSKVIYKTATQRPGELQRRLAAAAPCEPGRCGRGPAPAVWGQRVEHRVHRARRTVLRAPGGEAHVAPWPGPAVEVPRLGGDRAVILPHRVLVAIILNLVALRRSLQ